jgi:hypothetical protein
MSNEVDQVCTTSGININPEPCPYCGQLHKSMCPRIKRRAADIVKYMRKWPRAKVRDYCAKKGWKVSVVSQTERIPD